MTISFYYSGRKKTGKRFIKKREKGISHFLSAALLVLMVVVISTIVSGWLDTLTRSQTATIRNTTTEQLGCQLADLYIKNATFNCSGNCTAGNNHNVTVTITNSGKKAVNITTIVVRNTTGNIFSYDIGAVKVINVGEDVTVSNVSTTTCTGINRTFEFVEIYSVNCPGNAYDKLPGGSVTHLSC